MQRGASETNRSGDTVPSQKHPQTVASPWGDITFTPIDMRTQVTYAMEISADTPKTSSPATTSSGRPRADRAAQFMPFAALTGYYELVREQEHIARARYGRE